MNIAKEYTFRVVYWTILTGALLVFAIPRVIVLKRHNPSAPIYHCVGRVFVEWWIGIKAVTVGSMCDES